MVTTNIDPMSGVSEMVKRVDNPADRGESLFDGALWNANSRAELSIPLWTRLEIPNTNKHEMGKYATLLRGLATLMDHTSNNTALTEHDACSICRNHVRRANFKMKEIAKIDLRDQENRGNVRKLRSR